MLVLVRRKQSWTTLTLPDGREIRICVVDVRDGKARLGFEAPPDVAIVRDDAQSYRPGNRPAPLPPRNAPVARPTREPLPPDPADRAERPGGDSGPGNGHYVPRLQRDQRRREGR